MLTMLGLLRGRRDTAKASDRREFPRVEDSSRLKVRLVEAHEESSGDGMTLNISGGGIRFMHSEQLEKGALLAMELDLPGYPAGVIALARVKWCEQQVQSDPAMPYEVGAEFHWIGWESVQAQQNIASYIRTKLGDE